MINNFEQSRQNQTVIFFKYPLKGCCPALDLPTIGKTTAELLAYKKVTGIVIDPSVTICMQKQEVLKICDDAGMFVYGVQSPIQGA